MTFLLYTQEVGRRIFNPKKEKGDDDDDNEDEDEEDKEGETRSDSPGK